MANNELSARQKQLLQYIEEVGGQEHRMPSYREMAGALKLSAVGSIQDLLSALIDKGYLQKNGRHLSVSERRQASTVHVPIVGVVAAGTLSEALENNLGVMAMSSDFLNTKKGQNVFALKVSGQSMIEAGILEGDLVVIQSQNDYKSGDTVVVRYRGEATVKEIFFKSRDRNKEVTLHPRNSSMRDIIIKSGEAHELEILGKVIAVQRVLKN